MTPWLRWLAIVVGGGVLVHLALVWAAPRLIMGVVLHRIEGGQGQNRFLHPPMATADVRGIVRPSPDLAYSVCLLDVRNGPVYLSVPVSAPYTSISVFAANTDNIYVKNDRTALGGNVALLVASPNAPLRGDQADVVRLPSERGLALVRRVVTDAQHYQALQALRQQSECAPVPVADQQ